MPFRLERTGYVRASVSAFLGATFGIALLVLTRRYAWGTWSMVAFASLPLWGATVCWVSLRRAHVEGYAGTSFIVFLSVLLPMGGVPGWSIPLFAGFGGVLGRLLGSERSSRDGRQRDPRWVKITVVSLALLIVGGTAWSLLALQTAIVDGWNQDRAFALRVSDDAVCAKVMTEACAQDAADRIGGRVAWLAEVPEKAFAQFTAIGGSDHGSGKAFESFVAVEGPPRVLTLSSGLPSLAPTQGALSTTKTLAGVSYHLSASETDRSGLWDFATLSWQVDGTLYNLMLDGGLFGGPIEPEDLFDLVPEIRYAQPSGQPLHSP